MCGILGFWGAPGERGELERTAHAMRDALRHRGPDSHGAWCDAKAGLALGHARLAIVDLSPAGHQPMVSACGRYVLTYNGEVYNFEALRAELERGGHAPAEGWCGHSDTEVMLAAFAAWGVEASLAKFVGMFAFALWDRRERVLTLARDRMGIKPLYWGYLGGGSGGAPVLGFASELAALRRHPAFGNGVDPAAAGLYLRYLYVPAPYCILKGLAKLEPGCLVRVRAEDVAARRMPEPGRWWSVREAMRRGLADPLPDDDGGAAALAELTRVLSDAVRARMVADVPLGAFLSGGIDSSTVVALMQAASPRPVRTFTIGSPATGYDEAAHAKAVARHLGTEHTELYVRPFEAMEVIPLLARMYDEPFADASQIPTFLVSRLARAHVTVSLSGDGGDELFGGYNRYLFAPGIWDKLGPLPASARTVLAQCMRFGGERAVCAAYALASPFIGASRRQLIFRDKIQKVTEAMAATDRTAFFHSLVSFWKEPGELVRGLNGSPDGGLPPTRFTDPARQPATPRFLDWMMAMDQDTYLHDDILTKVDRASMAVSLEARVPILDHRVVELAWRVPMSLKIRGGLGKHILRELLYQHVPRDLVERPKQGFGIPLDSWLRGELRDWAEGLLAPGALEAHGLLRTEPVRRAWDEHLSGRRNLQYHLWGVLMLQAWLAEWGT
ncbi:MAG: asparagine synthase (glutamine-hydrolyzing) [Desulfovibrionaceae bacterium]|jgi:asparagine synthase (glutamine-hydrolysing)|nr:asparagine synthase (glutamine-hydrolyzing) [Desulfovibrionaceae bacterium]